MSRILIIDDDSLILAALKKRLGRELRYEVHCATDREEADALLDCYEYALVITDLSLSPQRLEGLDLVQRVANSPHRPKLIALTGNCSANVRSDALIKGADRFLKKPVSMKEIIDATRALVETGNEGAKSPEHVTEQSPLLASMLDSSCLRSFVQPVFQVWRGGHRLMGIECLTRGPLGTPFEKADVLFAYARRKRAEVALDRRCISLAFREIGAVSHTLKISVNVHASTLSWRDDFTDWLCQSALSNHLVPSQITLEVVELSPSVDKQEFLRTLCELRRAGVKIALDDFGLGQSNYQMMVDSKPDCFKIDRYFVDGCSRDDYRRAVVSSIVRLATDLGATVIAEGAEDPADVDALLQMGIGRMQSFLFCPPISSTYFRKKYRYTSELCAGSIRDSASLCSRLEDAGFCDSCAGNNNRGAFYTRGARMLPGLMQ